MLKQPAIAGWTLIPCLAAIAGITAAAPQPSAAQPTYVPPPSSTQPLPPWQPGKRVEAGVGDVGARAVGRIEPRLDLRLPTGFDGVYQLNKTDIFGTGSPGEPSQSVYMRMDGGLMAVFPRSVYRDAGPAGGGGLIPQIPAGTIFYIGKLPAGLVGAGKAAPFSPAGPAPDASQRGDSSAAPRPGARDTRLDYFLDTRPVQAPAAGIPNAVAEIMPASPSITIWSDEQFRQRRLGRLMSRLAGPD